ncbi:ABC transporter permease, partial [Candidatus Bathyarchaeota archaeon]|nr:ABC transporter permease [Candidatus Bathyarchaeota archaeon]
MNVKTLLSHSFTIAKKDLTELFRNRLGLVLLIVMPLFMMVMIGFIYPSNGSTLTNLPVALVNEDTGFNDSSIPSQAFIIGLNQINDQTNMLSLSISSSMADIKDKVQRGELNGGIVIPSNFSASLLSGEQGTVIIVTDQSNPTISATMLAVLSA